jgi:LPS export ABC transporter protein LptC
MIMRWYRAVGISIISGILLLAVLGWLFLSGRTQTIQPDAQQSETEQPDMRVQNLHLIEQTEAGDAWELWAREAEFYDAKKMVVVHHLRAQLLSQAAQPIHVVADYGRIDSVTGNMTVQGHVQLQYLEGYTVETEILHWQASDRVLQTEAAVQIHSALGHITGMGLLGHVEQQHFVLQDNVHAAFQVR